MTDTSTDSTPPPASPPAQGNFYGPQGGLGNALPGISNFGRWFSQHVAPAFSVKPQPAQPQPPATPPQPPQSTDTPDPNLPPKQDQPQQQKNLNELFPTIPDISKQLKPPPDPIMSGRRIQQFVPNATREAKLWGKPNRHMTLATRNPEIYTTPFMPADQEAIRVIAGGGRQLAQFAAPSVGGPMGAAAGIASMIGPFFDFFSGNAFSTAYRNKMLGGLQAQEAQMRMQEENMMMQRERMVDLSQQAMINHKLMLSDYGEVFDELKSGAITEEEADERIRELNTNNHHHVLDNILENQGPGGVQQALLLEDARFQDIMSSVMSLQASDKKSGKTAGDTSIDREIEGRPGTAAIGSSLLGAPIGGAPGAAGAAGPTGFTPEDIRDKTPEEINDEVAKEAQMPTAGGMHMADDILETGTIGGMNKSEIPKATKYGWSLMDAANKKKAMLGEIADSSMTPQDKLTAMRNVNPDIAGTVENLASFQTPVTDVPEAVRKDYERWAHGINPKFNTAKYEAAKKYWLANDHENQLMRTTAAIPQNALNVMREINKMSESEVIPERIVEQIIAGGTGDPKYHALGEAMQNYIQNASSAQSGTAPRVTLVKAMMERAKSHMSPATFREIMQQDVADAWAKALPYVGEWRDDLGQPGFPPSFREENVKQFSDILRMNTYTGQMPSDALQEFAAVGRDPSRTKYSGYVKGHEARPLTAAEVRQNYLLIEKYKNNPDPEIQKMVRQAQDRMPGIFHGPWEFADAPE